jgi:hypothetical protein
MRGKEGRVGEGGLRGRGRWGAFTHTRLRAHIDAHKHARARAHTHTQANCREDDA